MILSNISILLEADDKEKKSKDKEMDNDTNINDDDDELFKDVDKEMDDANDSDSENTDDKSDSGDTDNNSDDDDLFKDVDKEMDDADDSDSENTDETNDGEDIDSDIGDEDNMDDSESDSNSDVDTDETGNEDPYSKIEGVKNNNKRKKLLSDIINLYNYYGTLAIRLNELSNLDEEESNDVNVCIKKVYETRGIIFDYIQSMFIKDSYERALSLYYSFKIPSNFIYKIITKIAEKRNNN